MLSLRRLLLQSRKSTVATVSVAKAGTRPALARRILSTAATTVTDAKATTPAPDNALKNHLTVFSRNSAITRPSIQSALENTYHLSPWKASFGAELIFFAARHKNIAGADKGKVTVDDLAASLRHPDSGVYNADGTLNRTVVDLFKLPGFSTTPINADAVLDLKAEGKNILIFENNLNDFLAFRKRNASLPERAIRTLAEAVEWNWKIMTEQCNASMRFNSHKDHRKYELCIRFDDLVNYLEANTPALKDARRAANNYRP